MAPPDDPREAVGRLRPVMFELWLPRGPELHWQVLSVRGTEAISQPYEFEVELWSDDPDAALEQALGADCELLLDRNGHERRVFGVIAEIEILFAAELRIERDGIGARVRIVPAFRLLEQELGTRFFAGQTVIEILAELLGGRLAAYERSLDVESRIHGEYNRRDYCVQFRESTFGFCSRLLEEEGIAYVFVHDADAGSERMILVDNNEDYTEADLLVPEPIAVELDRPDELDRESLQAFHWRHTPTANRVLARGYNYKLGSPIDEGEAEELVEPRAIVREQVLHAAQRQIIDDPLDDPDARSFDGSGLRQAATLARRVLEAARVDADVGRGRGNAIGFMAGVVFELERPPAGGPRTSEFLLTRVVHSGGIVRNADASAYAYENQFECIPRTRVFRPARRTAKPRVHGVQTGVVIGRQGDEIHTDALGRVRVAFPLHRHDESEEHSSCWIRVAQIWAGPGYGAMVIPRVGMEVVVAFVDGDPDRPLITGCVYNGTNAPPYSLPEQMSKSTFKSASTPGSESFNELRFEDAAGREQVFVRAQRRMDLRVQGTLYETCAGNREEIVGGEDPYAEADGMHNTLVRGELNTIVHKQVYEQVEGRIHRNMTEVFEWSNAGRLIWDNRRYQVTSPEIVLESSDNISQKANFLNFAGSDTLSMRGGERIVIESNNALELRVGNNFVSISQAGIDISGLVLGLNSGGGVGQANEPLSSEEFDIEEPIEPLSADDGRIHKGGGGGGGRDRTHRKRRVEPHRAPDMVPPKPLPKPQDPMSPIDGSGTWVSLAWSHDQAWCSDPVNLRIEAHHPSAPESAYVRDGSDGELVAGVGVPARNGKFEQPVKLCDILPRMLADGREDSREFNAWLSTGLYSSNSLTLRFISNLEKMGYYEGRARFAVRISNHAIEVSSEIPYVRGGMGYWISLGDLAPDEAGGFIGVNEGGTTDWRWCKKIDLANVPRLAYWDGQGWRIVPQEFDDADGTKLYGVALWRENGQVVTQYGSLPWPDDLPEWAPENIAKLEQVKVDWAKAIDMYWSEKFDLKRDQCKGHEPKCCRYPVRCRVSFHEVAGKAKHGIVIGENLTRENSSAWSLETSGLVAAHEFGHHLGNPDEYHGASSVDIWVHGDGALFGIDEASIMNSDVVVRRRHLTTIAEAVARLVERDTGESFTYTPVEHIR